MIDKTKWLLAQKKENQWWENWLRKHKNDNTWLKTVLRYFELKKGQDFKDKVLVDIGSGPIGILTKFKAKRRIAVDPLAIDSFDDNIERIKVPAENIPLVDGVADCVFIYNVLQHVMSPEEVFSQGARILKIGGLFYILEQLNLPIDELHPHSLKLEMFMEWILQNNFEVIKISKENDCDFGNPRAQGSGYAILCLILKKKK